MATTIKRTYSARSKASVSTSSSPSFITSAKRKLRDIETENGPTLKKRLTSKLMSAAKPGTTKSSQRTLTQLHFSIDCSVLRTCSLCGLSYTKGAPDDEALHRSHCGRVQKGMEWGREEEREVIKAGVNELAVGVKLKDGTSGRIICFPANIGGRIGTKLAHLLETINLALESPPLTESILKCSKVYLFLVPSATHVRREKIVGCVIAQRISTAMAIATPEEAASACAHDSDTSSELYPSPTRSLVAVDTNSGLFCHPTALPTPLGIPRLFVSSAHRRQGIANQLLSATAATFIHGCPLDPLRGDVAFTQPTEGGNAVMRSWGKGFVRIYEE
ncbi:hypothetical protein BS17DRAFT_724145 [Gyrodon lividus]|nr:hypothetical protein BS17DRAFT_724145 [Gyrodon lividus]